MRNVLTVDFAERFAGFLSDNKRFLGSQPPFIGPTNTGKEAGEAVLIFYGRLENLLVSAFSSRERAQITRIEFGLKPNNPDIGYKFIEKFLYADGEGSTYDIVNIGFKSVLFLQMVQLHYTKILITGRTRDPMDTGPEFCN